jgi:hypothetical protein
MKILPKTKTRKDKNGKTKIVFDPAFSSFLEKEREEQVRRGKRRKRHFQYL